MNVKLMMVLFTGAVVAACGGGGGGASDAGGSTPVDAAGTVPASALASPTALLDWAREVPNDDAGEPVALSDLVPPKTDTKEPKPIS